MKKALFVLLAILAISSPALAQHQSQNLTTQGTCGVPPVNGSTAYVFVPINTANGGATIAIIGTWSGTVSFFANGPDGSWQPLNATPSNSGTAASTTTGNGIWQANVAGYSNICAAFTTASSGTAVVSLQLSQASARSSGGGGGGGGGISGTVSSPFMPFASGPDALSDSTITYTDPGILNVTGPEGGSISFTDSMSNTLALLDTTAGVTLTLGNPVPDIGGGILVLDGGSYVGENHAGDTTEFLGSGSLTLGSTAGGIGGSLTLNDATMGSFALATDTANPFGSALEFTNVGVMGTGQLDMAVVPDAPNIDVTWSAPGTFTPAVGWFIGPTTVKTIADIVDVNTTTLNPDTTGFPCGPGGLGDGQIAHFSDGDTNVWGAVLAGGGALFVEAYCDGNNWLVMGAAASTGPLSATTYSTATNCANGAAPAVCGSAAAGHVAVPTGATPTLVINTSAVTANSEILLTVDESSTISGVTCNTTLSTLPAPVVTARTAGTSFTVQVNATLLGTQACIGYSIIN